MRTYGEFVMAAAAAGRRARFGAEATAEHEQSTAERVITVGAILAAALVVSHWAKRY